MIPTTEIEAATTRQDLLRVRGALEALLAELPSVDDPSKRVSLETVQIARQALRSPMRPVGPAPTRTLTRRELEVLSHLANGATNDDLGQLMKISPHTAKFHMNNLLEKFDTSSRTHVVAIALRTGIIP